MLSKRSINWIFAITIAVLAGAAALSIRLNQGQSSVPEATSPAGLPESHPSLELINRLNDLERLSLTDPQNAEYQTEIGNIYYDLGRFQNAVEAYEKSLKLKPRDPAVSTDAATCYHNMGQDDKAIDLIDQVLQFSPNFAQALFNKGIILINGKKNIEAGIAAWEELLRANPNYPQKAELEEQIRQYRTSGR
jgi:tetratricopeptide (TPR) repeat protein